VKHVTILGLVCLLLLTVVLPTAAQTGGQVLVLPPDASTFPEITLHFDVFADDGAFVQNLSSSDLVILENSQQVQLEQLTQETTGVNFAVAYNTGPTLANRYAGQSRFAMLQARLLEWANNQPSETVDRFSLMTNTGMQAVESASPMEWSRVIIDFQPDLLNETPSLTSINNAIDAVNAADGSRKRVVLFITPPASDMQINGLRDLTSRAVQMDIRIHVWQIGPPDMANTEGGQALQEMAATTGGTYLTFSGSEGLPDIDTYLEPLRHHYTARYRSAIQNTGDHTLQLQVATDNGLLLSAEHTISLIVQPPNPMFMAPPAHIERQWQTPDGGGEPVLLPDGQPIAIFVEFPDGHPRALSAARLFVDGQLEQELTSPPFDAFTWNLKSYTSNASHELQVEVVDSQGLTAKSIVMPVQVDVEETPLGFTRRMVTNLSWREALIGVGGLVGVGALITGGNLVWRKFKQRYRNKATSKPAGHLLRDKSAWPRLTDGSLAPARLVRLDPTTQKSIGSGDIILLRRSLALGRAEVDEPSVGERHARIWADAGGRFMIKDAGSVAGTWVNLTPTPEQGLKLHHGDLVNFGSALFRFEEAHPAVRKISIELL